MHRILLAATCIFLGPIVNSQAEDDGLSREEKVRQDKQRIESEGFWLYNDYEGALKKARQTGKPILVVLRCLPCEECVKLDDELVDKDPDISKLIKQFVCVRIVGTNGLDLDVFQYDTDQSFAVFMLTADEAILGRFGTRSHRTEWLGDVSLKGMAEALQGGLDLHKDYPANKDELAGKRGKPLEFPSPEKYPKLRSKFTDSLNYDGDVVKSCIHCHQIGEARRDFYWQSGKPIPEKLMFSYPHPKSLGIILDPESKARVKDVVKSTPAKASGMQPGDNIVKFDGQPILSIADVQWVLHNTDGDGANLDITVNRGGRELDLSMNLDAGWRRSDNISWRVTSWTLCRMVLGGMRLVALDDQARDDMGIADSKMALRVKSAGKYGPHSLARRSGFEVDDVIVGYDGQDALLTESAVFAHANDSLRPGKSVTIDLLRDGKRLSKTLRIQD